MMPEEDDQEIAKTVGKAIDAIRSTGGWLDKIFGEAIEHTVGYHWTDKIKAKRIEAAIYDWERLTKLFEKVNNRIQKKYIKNLKTIPPKIALSIIEQATIEHEENLHDLWANLLTSAMDDDEEPLERMFISILSDLSVADAKELTDIYERWKSDDKKSVRDGAIEYGPGLDSSRHGEYSIRNFFRLGLIEASYIEFKTYDPPGHDDRYGEYGPHRQEIKIPGDLQVFKMTELGEAFCHAIGLD